MLTLAAGISMALATEPLKVDVKHKPRDKEWRSLETRTLEHAVGFSPRSDAMKLSKYGGDLSQKTEAKGFFYAKKIGDRWWLVDPEGYRFIHLAICSIFPATNSDQAKEAFQKKFGSNEKWAELTTAEMRVNGFNGSGSWSNDELLGKAPQRVAYCPNWNFMSSYGRKRGGIFRKPGHTGYLNNAIFVFDPSFETFAMEHAKKLVATKDDPWLLGHFSDNEMPLNNDCLENFLGLPKQEHGHKAAWEWLQKRKGAKASLKDINDQDRGDFLELVADRYFAIVSKAIKTHDPNHLYLGCRFHGRVKYSKDAFLAAGRHLDVISINHYGSWTPSREQLDKWTEWSGKPFIITEFYSKGADSGFPNDSGAGWLVKTQKDRGLFYQNFCIGLLESKNCVGWHYFRYQDNDIKSKRPDPLNTVSNKGIWTAYFEEYPDYLRLIKQLNLNVYPLIDWLDKGGKVHP
jgi:hypothetical protein